MNNLRKEIDDLVKRLSDVNLTKLEKLELKNELDKKVSIYLGQKKV